MSDAKQRIGADDEWYLYFPAAEEPEPPQPYRTAPTVWPLSANELSRTERAAQSTDKAERAAALNNLGTELCRMCFALLTCACVSCHFQE